jgi:hypothetical protein
MSSNSSNKTWLYILGAAGAFVAAAVIFHKISSSKEETTQHNSIVLEEIDALGPAKKEMNGLLSFPYYKDVFFII